MFSFDFERLFREAVIQDIELSRKLIDLTRNYRTVRQIPDLIPEFIQNACMPAQGAEEYAPVQTILLIQIILFLNALYEGDGKILPQVLRIIEMLNNLNNEYLRRFDKLDQEIENLSRFSKEELVRKIEVVKEDVISEGRQVKTEIAAEIALVYAEFQPVNLKLDAILAALEGLEGTILEESREIKGSITRSERAIKEHVDQLKETLVNDISEEVSLKIVGESFYKWDSTSSYYPTLIFVFRESTIGSVKRKSQIKLRYFKNNNEITDQDIQNLKNQALGVRNLGYSYGTNRGNFVSTDKRFKTTIYAQSRDEIKRTLERILPFANEVYDERNLSFTEKSARVRINKRTVETAEIPLNRINYDENFYVQLYRISLLVNGSGRPILIYKA
jgi:hypothetical protein